MTNLCFSKTLFQIIKLRTKHLQANNEEYMQQSPTKIDSLYLSHPCKPHNGEYSDQQNSSSPLVKSPLKAYTSYYKKQNNYMAIRIIHSMNKNHIERKTMYGQFRPIKSQARKSTSTKRKAITRYPINRSIEQYELNGLNENSIDYLENEIYKCRYSLYRSHIRIVNGMKSFLLSSGSKLHGNAIKKILGTIDYLNHLINEEELEKGFAK